MTDWRPSTVCKERNGGHMCGGGEHPGRPHRCLCGFPWLTTHPYEAVAPGAGRCWCGANLRARIHIKSAVA